MNLDKANATVKSLNEQEAVNRRRASSVVAVQKQPVDGVDECSVNYNATTAEAEAKTVDVEAETAAAASGIEKRLVENDLVVDEDDTDRRKSPEVMNDRFVFFF
jgi:hypothetical protein